MNRLCSVDKSIQGLKWVIVSIRPILGGKEACSAKVRYITYASTYIRCCNVMLRLHIHNTNNKIMADFSVLLQLRKSNPTLESYVALKCL